MRALVVGLLLALLGQSSAQQANPFLLPERASSRINASVEIAKQLRQMGYNRIAVVYMETSELCALFSASLVASLKTLGVEAYYVKGGEGLAGRLKALMPAHVYMAYFGDRPHAEVQTQFNRDMKEVLRYDKKPSLVLQPALVALGFVGGLLVEEELSSALQDHPMRSFIFEEGRAKPTRVTLKDLEVKVAVESPPPQTQKPEKPAKRR